MCLMVLLNLEKSRIEQSGDIYFWLEVIKEKLHSYFTSTNINFFITI